VEQASCRISDTGCSLGNYPFRIPVPAKNKRTGASTDEPQLNYDAGKTDGRTHIL
jgi:hypothetical protein